MAKNTQWTWVDAPPKGSPFYGRLSVTAATPSKAPSEPSTESSDAARDKDSEDSPK